MQIAGIALVSGGVGVGWMLGFGRICDCRRRHFV